MIPFCTSTHNKVLNSLLFPCNVYIFPNISLWLAWESLFSSRNPMMCKWLMQRKVEACEHNFMSCTSLVKIVQESLKIFIKMLSRILIKILNDPCQNLWGSLRILVNNSCWDLQRFWPKPERIFKHPQGFFSKILPRSLQILEDPCKDLYKIFQRSFKNPSKILIFKDL